MTTCSACGHEEADAVAATTWTVSVERGRRQSLCVVCSREHLRSMEGKLDVEWW